MCVREHALYNMPFGEHYLTKVCIGVHIIYSTTKIQLSAPCIWEYYLVGGISSHDPRKLACRKFLHNGQGMVTPNMYIYMYIVYIYIYIHCSYITSL